MISASAVDPIWRDSLKIGAVLEEKKHLWG
jgi:hypothetical protein